MAIPQDREPNERATLGIAFKRLQFTAKMAGVANTDDWKVIEPAHQRGYRYLEIPNDVDPTRDTRYFLGKSRHTTIAAIHAIEAVLCHTPGYRAARHAERPDLLRAAQALEAAQSDDDRSMAQRREACGVENYRPHRVQRRAAVPWQVIAS